MLTSRRRERVEHLARRALGCALDPECDRVGAASELAAAALDATDLREAIDVLVDQVRPTDERERAMLVLSNALMIVESGARPATA